MAGGLCSFGDCIPEMIGFAVVGLALGVTGAFVLGRYGKKSPPVTPPTKEDEEMAGLGRRRRPLRIPRKRSYSGCGCGG